MAALHRRASHYKCLARYHQGQHCPDCNWQRRWGAVKLRTNNNLYKTAVPMPSLQQVSQRVVVVRAVQHIQGLEVLGL
jgi:hypothetical protein